jgi:RNA polymerase sigma-70 factor, ECF subfamily
MFVLTPRIIVGRMGDKELILLAREGNEEARERIFFAYCRMVKGIALRFSGRDVSCAEDLRQKTFLKVFSSLGEIREPYHLKSWISRIAYCTGLDYVRSNKKEKIFLRKYSTLSKLGGNHQFSPEEEVIGSQYMDLVANIVENIPNQEFRRTVVLFFESGLSYPEVCSKQEIKMEVARKRISRFRVLVKKNLLKMALEETNE